MGLFNSKPKHSTCKLILAKSKDNRTKMDDLIDLVYPTFKFADCDCDVKDHYNQYLTVCRFCGESSWLVGTSNYENSTYPTGQRLVVYDFWRHLWKDHGDRRYILCRAPAGDMYYAMCDTSSTSCNKCIDSDIFVKQNPHVLFVATDGPDHYGDGKANSPNGFHYMSERLLINNNNFYPEESLLLIQKIMNGASSCIYCGMEYETFPTYDYFAAHINSCLPSAESINAELRAKSAK